MRRGRGMVWAVVIPAILITAGSIFGCGDGDDGDGIGDIVPGEKNRANQSGRHL